jgi:hypothetical protein
MFDFEDIAQCAPRSQWMGGTGNFYKQSTYIKLASWNKYVRARPQTSCITAALRDIHNHHYIRCNERLPQNEIIVEMWLCVKTNINEITIDNVDITLQHGDFVWARFPLKINIMFCKLFGFDVKTEGEYTMIPLCFPLLFVGGIIPMAYLPYQLVNIFISNVSTDFDILLRCIDEYEFCPGSLLHQHLSWKDITMGWYYQKDMTMGWYYQNVLWCHQIPSDDPNNIFIDIIQVVKFIMIRHEHKQLKSASLSLKGVNPLVFSDNNILQWEDFSLISFTPEIRSINDLQYIIHPDEVIQRFIRYKDYRYCYYGDEPSYDDVDAEGRIIGERMQFTTTTDNGICFGYYIQENRPLLKLDFEPSETPDAVQVYAFGHRVLQYGSGMMFSFVRK